MQQLLVASFALIALQIPGRNLLKHTSWVEAGILFAFTTLLGVVPVFFPVSSGNPEFTTSLLLVLFLGIGGTVFFTLITWLLVNRYAKDTFSIKEIFILGVLLSAGLDIIASAANVIVYFA